MLGKKGRGKTKNAGQGYLFSNDYLIKLLWPLFVDQFMIYAVGLIDSMMVASIGEAAVSAVSLTGSVMALIITILAALASGGSVVVGQLLGHDSEADSNRAAEQLIMSAIMLSLGITAAMYVFKDEIISLFFGETAEDVLRFCDVYYLIVVASIPFVAVFNSGSALFRSMGNSKTSMLISTLMNLINVAGNAVLIYGFHRGVGGAAAATLVSRIFAAAVMISLLRDQRRKIHIAKRVFVRPDISYIGKLFRIGLPNCVEQSMFQFGKLILVSMISEFGTASIAANAVANSVTMIAVLPGNAMCYGIMSVISICVGTGDYTQVRYYAGKLMKWAYAAMLVTNMLIMALLPVIMRIYGLPGQTAHMAVQLIVLYCVFAIFLWPTAFNTPWILRAAGDVKYTMITGVASMMLVRILFGIILAKFAGMGVFGVWIAMIADWVVRSAFFCGRYRGEKWKQKAVQ